MSNETESAPEEFETTVTVEVTEEVAANPEALAAAEDAAIAEIFGTPEPEPVVKEIVKALDDPKVQALAEVGHPNCTP